jgi:hypothetical protein
VTARVRISSSEIRSGEQLYNELLQIAFASCAVSAGGPEETEIRRLFGWAD